MPAAAAAAASFEHVTRVAAAEEDAGEEQLKELLIRSQGFAVSGFTSGILMKILQWRRRRWL